MKNNLIKKLIYLMLAVILTVSIASGCAPSDTATDTKDPMQDIVGDISEQETAAQADDKFTLRYSTSEELNPISCENVYNDAVTSLMYEGLFRLEDGFRPVNVLCKEYSTEDGLSYTFKIIDAKMHDGGALTASDVTYSINEARLSSKYSARLSNIIYCGYDDDETLYIDLAVADYSLPALLDVPIIRYGSMGSAHPAGTGPYCYRRTAGADGLVAFKDYRTAENITLDRIYLKEFTDASVEESFANYTLDCIWEDTAGDKPVNLYSDHEARYYDTSILQYVGFNSETPVLNDPNMRLAIGCAVDRSFVVDDIYEGDGIAADLILHPNFYAYSDSWESGYGYSPAKISQYLAASGLDDKNGDGYLEYPVNGEHQYFELKFVVYEGNDKKLEAAKKIVENLQHVGLKVTIVPLTWEEYKAALYDGDFDLYYAEVAFTRNFDFSNLLGKDGFLDFGKMGSEELGALCRSFLNAVTDEEKAAVAQLLCKTVAETAPVIPVMYRQYVVYTHRGVISNFSPTVSGVFCDAAEWKVKLNKEN